MKLIDGVVVKNLKVIADDRGWLMEMLRNDDPFFQKFGQVYITTVNPGVAKAWHYHKLQTDHFVCVKGQARVALYDDREESSTKGEVNEFIMGKDNPILLVIPKGVYHGFESNIDEESTIVNIPTETYNYKEPDEYRLEFNTGKIPFKWKATRGG